MMRSLFSGVQGLRAHQVRMDVIGNNIANVNTTAFKAGRVNFGDMYSQMLAGASRPTTAVGGTNAKQVGLGVDVSSIDTIQTQGALQLTGRTTDLAIAGQGLFVLREGGRFLYSRAGNFDMDAEGFLVNPATGQRVQGWLPDANGVFPTRDASSMTDVRIPLTDAQLAQATSKVTFDQALNSNVSVGSVHTAAYTAIDSLGREHTFTINFTKVAANAWDVQLLNPQGLELTLSQVGLQYGGAAPAPAYIGAAPADSDHGRIQFNTDGSLMDNDADAATPFQMNFSYTPTGASAMNVALDFSKVIQPALPGNTTTSSLRMLEFDGYTTGTLTNINVDPRGVITGFYSNGNFREIAQVATASFANPGGLTREAGNNWGESVNSGLALIGAAGEGGRGSIAPNNLEMSNVDISAEFTNMIVTQRGFQANSRIITTTDELLQEIVNLKR